MFKPGLFATINYCIALRKFFQPRRIANLAVSNQFITCLAVIATVSIYDSYLVVLYRDFILFDERNPICEILIRKDPDDLSWFLAGKLIGNILVVATLCLLRWVNYQRTMTVAISVAAFQVALLCYLSFSDPISGFLHFDGLMSPDPSRFSRALTSLVWHVAGMVGTVGIAFGVRYRSKSHGQTLPAEMAAV